MDIEVCVCVCVRACVCLCVVAKQQINTGCAVHCYNEIPVRILQQEVCKIACHFAKISAEFCVV